MSLATRASSGRKLEHVVRRHIMYTLGLVSTSEPVAEPVAEAKRQVNPSGTTTTLRQGGSHAASGRPLTPASSAVQFSGGSGSGSMVVVVRKTAVGGHAVLRETPNLTSPVRGVTCAVVAMVATSTSTSLWHQVIEGGRGRWTEGDVKRRPL